MALLILAGAMNAKGWHSRGYLPKLMAGPITDADRDAFLDAGSGNCWLREPEIARIVEDALLHFDGERYRLIAWTVMPNHVHALIEPAVGNGLGSIVSSWKRFSARMANRVLGHAGPFWQDDYWDTYIRNERHFESTISYIENNPVKAGLVKQPADWPWGHARLNAA